MKNGILRGSLFLLLLFISTSCSQDQDDQLSLLGTWVETAPVPERTTLVFAQNNRLTRIDGDGNAEEYTYRIEDNTLHLSQATSAEGTSELFIEQINENRLKVENLYVSIPEAEPSFIIFERF